MPIPSFNPIHLQADANVQAYLNQARKRAAEAEARRQYDTFENSAEAQLMSGFHRALNLALPRPSLSRPETPEGSLFEPGYDAGLVLSLFYKSVSDLLRITRSLPTASSEQSRQLQELADQLAPLVVQLEPQRRLAAYHERRALGGPEGQYGGGGQ